MKSLPIYEYFHSWQGEGTHLGRAAFFIRTFGCPVHCPWCDAAGTWHPDYIPEKVSRYTPAELAERAVAAQPDFVVITGGEPTIHDLRPLTAMLHDHELPCHLETCGAFVLRGDFDWITLSPKVWKKPLRENLSRADEVKLIVEDESTIDFWMTALGSWIEAQDIWLQPEWSQRENPKILASISEKVKTCGAPFRAGYQFHKLYGVDALDPHCKEAVPLGGDS